MKLKGTGALKRVVVEQKPPVAVATIAPPLVAPVAAQQTGRAGQGDALEKGTNGTSTSTVGAHGGAGGGSTLLRAKLGAELDKAKQSAAQLPQPPIVGPIEGDPGDVAPQPNLYVSSLGGYAQLAKFIDDNYGNRDGVITVAELQKFVAAYGRDPGQRNGIVGLAMQLGVATVEQGGVIQLAHMNNLGITVTINVGGQTTIHTGGGGGQQTNHTPRTNTTPRTNNTARTNHTYDAWSVAHALVRQTQDANAFTVQETIRSLASLPPKVLDILTRNGVQVIVANKVTDYRPDLRFEKPRGWPPGSTWAQPAGMYDPNRKQIVIANGGSGAQVVGHEVGHALDAIGWTRSRENNFVKMYNADYNALVRNAQHYLLQPGEAGLSEAFAESHGWYQTNPAWLARAYPNLHAYWDWVVQNGYREVGG